MFKIYKSNKLNILLSIVYQIIQEKPLSNIFEKEIFIHDNTVLFQYLNIFIANKIGISTNFKLYHPSDFIWKLFQKILSDKNLKNTFTHSIMTWKIMSILEKKNQYFYKMKNKIEKFKFAFLMAKIFEEYLFYRPDWINLWEKEKNVSSTAKSEIWQIKLWKEIISYTKKNENIFYHFSSLFNILQSLIKEKKIKKKDFPKRCFVISSFSLNPSYIKIFKSISSYIHVYFLYITPYKNNIFSVIEKDKVFSEKKTKKENILNMSLIELWGQYEKIYAVHIIKSKKIKIINCFKKNKKNNLLDNIKNKFFEYKKSNTDQIQKKCLKFRDNSISINICYNKKNEIEILYEKLLILFDKNLYISPGDIVITSFSIDTYIPYINAVFQSSKKKEQIPFFISKKFSKKTEITLSFFYKVLNLENSRFKNEEILELLDIPEIAKNFNIVEDEIDILYNWIEEANIRWAINSKQKDYLSFPKNHQNTWFYGIEKLLLSYAMNNTENIWNNILSCSIINGSRTELLEKLISFIKMLEKWKKKISKPKSLISWRSLSNDLINDFFYKSDKIEKSIQILKKNWKEMIDDSLSSNYLNKVSINILKINFIYKNECTNNQKFLPGVVNFCHPSSICYIPFKVIYFIGADNQSIPKNSNIDNFNLLKKYPLIGDVNPYQKYCYLFLQSITCSLEYFYISYVGYSIKDESKIYPSILVDQLLSYIGSHFYLIKNKNLSAEDNTKKIIKHLCKTYKKEYFYKKKHINNVSEISIQNTFQKTDIKTYKKIFYKKNFFNKNINLIDLIRFWKNPIRYFFNFTLKIKFNQNKKKINTTEPFLVNKLDSFKIKNIILNTIINKKDTKQLFQYYMLSGKLPYNFFGKIFWDEKIKEINSIAQSVIKYRFLTKEKKINLKIQKYQINGILSEIQSTGLLRWKTSIINYSDRIALWIEHLIYSISGGHGESKIIGYKNQTWSFSSLNPNIAHTYLIKYIEGYKKGIKQPLILTQSGASWLDQVYDIKNNCIQNDDNIKIKGYKKLLKNWIGNNYIKGEKEDFYIQKIITKLNKNNIKDICKIAEKWLIPILKNKKIKNEY